MSTLKLVHTKIDTLEQAYRLRISLLEQRLMFADAAEKLNGETIQIQREEIRALESEVARLKRERSHD